ncbi:MAG: dehydrogenase, partial [Vicinamibacterales bacterium]
PGVDAAIAAYRNAANDPDLAGLLSLFCATESVMTRWVRRGEEVAGVDDRGTTLVRVPMREPVHVRAGFDKVYQVMRSNCP